jgi:hypothetical protein
MAGAEVIPAGAAVGATAEVGDMLVGAAVGVMAEDGTVAAGVMAEDGTVAAAVEAMAEEAGVAAAVAADRGGAYPRSQDLQPRRRVASGLWRRKFATARSRSVTA